MEQVGSQPEAAVSPPSAASLAPWHHLVDLNQSIDKLNPSLTKGPQMPSKCLKLGIRLAPEGKEK